MTPIAITVMLAVDTAAINNSLLMFEPRAPDIPALVSSMKYVIGLNRNTVRNGSGTALRG